MSEGREERCWSFGWRTSLPGESVPADEEIATKVTPPVEMSHCLYRWGCNLLTLSRVGVVAPDA